MTILSNQLNGFVPTEQANEIMKKVARGSSVIRLSKVEPMTTETKKIPVLTEGPGAYWVGEGERIQTSGATWIFPELTAKKLAVIIPVSKEKLNDTTINVFTELEEPIAEAFYKALDAAALFGTSSPFAKNIYQCAVDSLNIIVDDSSIKLDLSISDTMAKVEDKGLDVNGFAAHYGIKNRMRKLRDTVGNQLFVAGTDQNELYNNPIEFVRNGAWNKDEAEIIAADWTKSLVGIRQDIEFEILKEATLQGTLDADGKPISLAEQDLIGIKATMRVGFLPIKDDAFAILRPIGDTIGALTVTSIAGTAIGDTAITITESLGSGNSYKYKVGDNPSSPVLEQTCSSGWTNWNGTDDITAATGKKIVVVEVDANNKAVKTGYTTVTAKA